MAECDEKAEMIVTDENGNESFLCRKHAIAKATGLLLSGKPFSVDFLETRWPELQKTCEGPEGGPNADDKTPPLPT